MSSAPKEPPPLRVFAVGICAGNSTSFNAWCSLPGPTPTICAPPAPPAPLLSTRRWSLRRGCSLAVRLFTLLPFHKHSLPLSASLERPSGHTPCLRAPQICRVFGSSELVTATGPLPGLRGAVPSRAALNNAHCPHGHCSPPPRSPAGLQLARCTEGLIVWVAVPLVTRCFGMASSHGKGLRSQVLQLLLYLFVWFLLFLFSLPQFLLGWVRQALLRLGKKPRECQRLLGVGSPGPPHPGGVCEGQSPAVTLMLSPGSALRCDRCLSGLASSHLVTLGGCNLHVVPAGPEAGLALQKLSISSVNQFVLCKVQRKSFVVFFFFLSTLGRSPSPSVGGHDLKPGGTMAYELCGEDVPWAALALQVPFPGLSWGGQGCAQRASGSSWAPGTSQASRNGRSQDGVLQRWHFVWCCRSQEALNAWMENLSITVLIKCAIKRIPLPFPAPAHLPLSPSPFSSCCGMEPSSCMETWQHQGLGKIMLLG